MSTDIDLFLPDHDNVGWLRPGRQHDLARLTGGEFENDGPEHLSITWPNGHAMDVTCGKRPLMGLEATEGLEGREETIEHNAQIIAGKLSRTSRHVTRDAFDIICCAKADGPALQLAINSYPRTTQRTAIDELRSANHDFAAVAYDDLSGIAPEWETDLTTLGIDAARALEQHRYRQIEIVKDGPHLKVMTNCSRFGDQETVTSADNLTTTLERTATRTQILADHGCDPRTLKEVAQSPWNGKILDTRDDEPWRRSERALQESRSTTRQAGRRQPDDQAGVRGKGLPVGGTSPARTKAENRAKTPGDGPSR